MEGGKIEHKKYKKFLHKFTKNTGQIDCYVLQCNQDKQTTTNNRKESAPWKQTLLKERQEQTKKN